MVPPNGWFIREPTKCRNDMDRNRISLTYRDIASSVQGPDSSESEGDLDLMISELPLLLGRKIRRRKHQHMGGIWEFTYIIYHHFNRTMHIVTTAAPLSSSIFVGLWIQANFQRP